MLERKHWPKGNVYIYIRKRGKWGHIGEKWGAGEWNRMVWGDAWTYVTVNKNTVAGALKTPVGKSYRPMTNRKLMKT